MECWEQRDRDAGTRTGQGWSPHEPEQVAIPVNTLDDNKCGTGSSEMESTKAIHCLQDTFSESIQGSIPFVFRRDMLILQIVSAQGTELWYDPRGHQGNLAKRLDVKRKSVGVRGRPGYFVVAREYAGVGPNTGSWRRHLKRTRFTHSLHRRISFRRDCT
jgi:hypothetical protein